MAKREQSLDRFWDSPLRALLEVLQASPAGLTSEEAKERLRLYGTNSLVGKSRWAPLIGFLRFFANPSS
jgi:magnesium-transporting ATPase (P-type)